jgi:hypothetical protein
MAKLMKAKIDAVPLLKYFEERSKAETEPQEDEYRNAKKGKGPQGEAVFQEIPEDAPKVSPVQGAQGITYKRGTDGGGEPEVPQTRGRATGTAARRVRKVRSVSRPPSPTTSLDKDKGQMTKTRCTTKKSIYLLLTPNISVQELLAFQRNRSNAVNWQEPSTGSSRGDQGRERRHIGQYRGRRNRAKPQ